MPKLPFILTTFVLLMWYATQAQYTYRINYTSKQGLPSNTVYFAMQDHEGFIWLGTDAGLCRYDGQRFITFTPQDGLADNEVFQIREDSKSRLWLFHYNGHLSYLDHGVFHNPESDTTLAAIETPTLFASFLEDSHQRIWITDFTGKTFVINPDGRVSRFSQHFSTMELWEDNGYVYGLQSGPTTLIRYDITDITRQEQLNLGKTFLNIDASKKIAHLKKRHTLLCPSIEGGFMEVDYKTNTIQQHFSDKGVMGVTALDDHRVWVYLSSGVFLWDGEHAGNIELSDEIVAHAFRDNNGGWWFSTLNNGMYYYPSVDIKVVPYEGSGSPAIRRVVVGAAGDIIAFKETGAYMHVDPKNYTTRQIPSSLGRGNVRVDEVMVLNDTMWITGKAAGLIRNINDQSTTLFAHTSIRDISFSGNQTLLSCGYAGIKKISRQYFTHDKERKRDMDVYNDSTNRIFHRRAFAISEFGPDRFIFGSNNGLQLYDHKQVTSLKKLHPFLQHRITQIKTDRQGNRWIVVDATGVIVLNKNLKVIAALDEKSRIYQEPPLRLYLDKDGTAWIISKHVVYRANLTAEGIKSQLYFTVESEDLNDIVVQDDKVWLGSTAGLIVLPLPLPQQQEMIMRITSAFANGTEIKTDQLQTLSSYQSNIRLDFVGISFNQKNIHYRYRIRDNDPWTMTTNTHLEFSSLPPGRYTIQLQAMTPTGSWSTPASTFEFLINRPFWQTWWFVLIVALSVIGTIWILVRWRYQINYNRIMLHDRLVESELKALVAQMNPHFIFNTLNTIQRFFLTSDTKTANRLLTRFSALMRKMLENTSHSFISLENEITFLDTYIEIEKIRFNHKFEYTIETKGIVDKSAIMVPSMTIQPFVENAILHGLMAKPSSGKLTLFFRKDQHHLYVCIEDDGVGRKEPEHRTHTPRGISLIRERLAILNSKNKTNYRINITDLYEPTTGTRVELYL